MRRATILFGAARQRAIARAMSRRLKNGMSTLVSNTADGFLYFTEFNTGRIGLVQAYVVPTGSMETNLRVGDHMLVDRLTFSDPGTIGRHILPYRDVQRGDIERRVGEC